MPTSGQKNSDPTATRCTCMSSWTTVESSDAAYQPEK